MEEKKILLENPTINSTPFPVSSVPSPHGSTPYIHEEEKQDIMKNKNCTTIEQSKRLVKLGLSSNTADCYWDHDVIKKEDYPMFMDDQYDDLCIPAWSLSRLLIILRDWQCVWLGANDVASWVTEFNLGSGKHYTTDPTTDPLDAAYNCLVWLIENGKIDPKEITI